MTVINHSCGTCGEEKEFMEADTDRADQRNETKRMKEAEVHGGTGAGC